MRNFIFKFLSVLFVCTILFSFSTVSATEFSEDVIAEDITDSAEISYDGKIIKISSEKTFFGIYIEWKTIPGKWSLFDGENASEYGEKSFLHEFAAIKDGTGYAEIRLSAEVAANDIYVFSDGKLPDWVQVWNEPCEKADLMLCSTHADDEQLFFLGVLPYYAGELGLNVQVVYFVNHNDTDNRPHELLNGLWTVGVRNYPVIGEAPDQWSESLEEGLANFTDRGFSEDKLIEFQVEMIRRFKPLVIVGHDIKGEYSHGQHIVNTHTLRQALEISNDVSQYTESAEKYGIWDVPKTYLHLYEENQIIVDWDIPLEKFGGKTAYEVSLDGFKCHESQHWTWFSKWIGLKSDWGVTKASDIKDYSPCKYGLYRSNVGEDMIKKDFLENIVLYRDQSEDLPDESGKPVVSDDILGSEQVPESPGKNSEDLKDKEDVDDTSSGMMILVYVIILIFAIGMVVFIAVKKIRS